MIMDFIKIKVALGCRSFLVFLPHMRTFAFTMQPIQHPALNLPEVITAIGSFLPHKSIVACLQVNSSFHSLLAPFIYNSLKIYSRYRASRQPLTQTLERYAHLVHDLSINSFVSLAYLTAGYRNLRSISFSSFKGNQSAQIGTDDEILDALLQLVRDNPGLTTWILVDPWPQIPAFIWKVIAETTADLDMLLLNNTRVSEEARPWFLMACRKARQLNLTTVTVEGPESSNNFTGHTDASPSPSSQQAVLQSLNPSFSPQTVSLDDVPGLSMLEQLELLTRCQHLKSIFWRSVDQYTHLQLQKATEQDVFFMRAEMQRLFHSITWSCLTSVHIENQGDYSDNPLRRNLTDECMCHILKSIPPGRLKNLFCTSLGMGTEGLKSLSRHFSNLCVLNARGNAVITSPVLQQLLESCPQLTRIDAIELHIRDIRKGGPWVCGRMVELSFSFNLWLEQDDVGWRDFACSPLTDKAQDAVETTRFIHDQHHVFDRLASLTALESLDVQTFPLRFNSVTGSDGLVMIHYGELDFRVSHGLQKLSTLKELRNLDVSASYQRLEREDVEMMVALWPKLNFLGGRLTSDKHVEVILRDYLEERNIYTVFYDSEL